MTESLDELCECGAMTAIACGKMPGRHCGLWDDMAVTHRKCTACHHEWDGPHDHCDWCGVVGTICDNSSEGFS